MFNFILLVFNFIKVRSVIGSIIGIVIFIVLGVGYCSYKTKEKKQIKEVKKQAEIIKKKALEKSEVLQDIRKKDDMIRKKELKEIEDKAVKTEIEQTALDSEKALNKEIEQSRKEKLDDNKKHYLKKKARMLKVIE